MFDNVFDWYSTLWIILECQVGSTRAQIAKERFFWDTLYVAASGLPVCLLHIAWWNICLINIAWLSHICLIAYLQNILQQSERLPLTCLPLLTGGRKELSLMQKTRWCNFQNHQFLQWYYPVHKNILGTSWKETKRLTKNRWNLHYEDLCDDYIIGPTIIIMKRDSSGHWCQKWMKWF